MFSKIFGSAGRTSASPQDDDRDPMDERNDEEQEEDTPLETQLPLEPEPFATMPHVTFPSKPEIHRNKHSNNNNMKSTSSGNLTRFRSLSKAFTKLPSTLPNATQMLADQLEFWCHVLLLESDPLKFTLHAANMEQTLRWFKVTEANGCLEYGRLLSRTLLAGCVSDIMCLTMNDYQLNQNDALTNANSLPSDRWNRILENVIYCKTILLRRNADTVEQLPTKNSEDGLLDDQLAQHQMMTDDFHDLQDLLKVQCALAKFREDLTVKVMGTFLTPRKQKELKQIESALHNYHEALQQVFPGTSSLPTLPHDLNMVGDLYSPKTHHQETIPNLLQHLQKLLGGQGNYSLTNLQQKFRGLLLNWSESILSTPVLFQLGYGGVPSMINVDDDDVSSWGDELDVPPTTRRTRSFEKRVAKKSPRSEGAGAAILRTPRLPPEMRPAPTTQETKKVHEEQPPRRDLAVSVLSDSEDDVDEEPVAVVKLGRQLANRKKPPATKSPPAAKRKVAIKSSSGSEDEIVKPWQLNKARRKAPSRMAKKTPPKRKAPSDDSESSDEEPRVVKYSRRVARVGA